MLVLTAVTLLAVAAGLVYLPEFTALASTVVTWFGVRLGIVR